MWKLVILAGCIALATAVPKSNCETNDDCDDNSCCVPMRRFYIMSKRDVRPKAKIDFINPMAGGRCVKYIAEDASCHTPGFASCGCEPGTKCNYYPEDELKKLPVVFKKSATEKRKIIYRPGKSICEKE